MQKEVLTKELQFKATRSSGPGGQHVNKVSSKVVLSFDITRSEGLSQREKRLLYKAFASRLTNEKVLVLSCEEYRSQFQNKQAVIVRFLKLIKKGLFVPKKRLVSKPSKAALQRNKEKKKQRSELKASRKKINV